MDAFFHDIVSGRLHGWMPELLRKTLGGCALAYRTGVATRNLLYDIGLLRAHGVSVPVISVGNLTLGGTGKTPVVEFACRWFLDRGKRVAILSRGYGSSAGLNDEALVLLANLPQVPHLQGKNRVDLARTAIEQFSPDVLVLDDGFQHRRLARDLDLVLVDCTNPFGWGHLFPRGLLREPIASLKRCDIIALSRTDHCSTAARAEIEAVIQRIAGPKPWVAIEHRPTSLRSSSGSTQPLTLLANRSVLAFCGIGNPDAFWSTLRQLGCNPRTTRSFPDHHAYSSNDLRLIESELQGAKVDLVITTHKDLVKIPREELGGRPLFALNIQAVVKDDTAQLISRLESLLGAPSVAEAA